MSARGLAASISVAMAVMAGSVARGAEGVQFRTVLMREWQPPGMSGVRFGAFGPRFVNGHGQMTFQTTMEGDGITAGNNEAIWLWQGDGFVMIAREGDQVPGLAAGVKYGSLNVAQLNDAGTILLKAQTSSNEVILSGPPNSLQVVARRNPALDQAPNEFSFFSANTLLSQSGVVVFGASGFPSARSGLWLSEGGVLTQIAQTGAAAPGNARVYPDFGNNVQMRINAADQIEFGGGPAIWFRNRAQAVQKLVETGDTAPGTEAGVIFGTFDELFDLNNAGQMVFKASLAGPIVTAANSDGIWRGAPGALQLVARTGDRAPGTGDGAVFSWFFWPTLMESGAVLFTANLSGPGIDETLKNFRGVWLGKPGSLSLLARQGDHAPGTENGVVFSALSLPGTQRDDYVTIGGLLSGPGVTSDNDLGLWEWFPDGSARLLVREGDVIEVAPGDFRTISSLFSPHPGTLMRGGDVLFTAEFTDGTVGQILASVPEPASLAMACIIILFCSQRRRPYG